MERQPFPQLSCSLIRVNAPDTNAPIKDNLAMNVVRKIKHQPCRNPIPLTLFLPILGFKRDRWSWGPIATEVFPASVGASTGQALWRDYIWRNRRLSLFGAPSEGLSLTQDSVRPFWASARNHTSVAISRERHFLNYWRWPPHSKWHFVNSKKTASHSSFATFHLSNKRWPTLLFCPLKMFYFITLLLVKSRWP